MSQDQDFQLIVCKEDYDKLKNWELKCNDLQILYKSLQKENQTIKKQMNLSKKLLYERKQQVTFLLDKISELFDVLNGKVGFRELQISQSYYQQLADLQAEGISKIEQQALKQQLQFEHLSLTKKIKQAQRNFSNLKDQVDKLTSAINKRNSQDEAKKPLNQKKSLDEEIITDIVKENKELKLQLSEKEKEITYLTDLKLQWAKQIQQLKAKLSKLQEIEKGRVVGEKSNRIKILIDEYYQELQKNLIQMGGLEQAEMEALVTNQLNGIIQYVKTLMTKKMKNIQKRK